MKSFKSLKPLIKKLIAFKHDNLLLGSNILKNITIFRTSKLENIDKLLKICEHGQGYYHGVSIAL